MFSYPSESLFATPKNRMIETKEKISDGKGGHPIFCTIWLYASKLINRTLHDTEILFDVLIDTNL